MAVLSIAQTPSQAPKAYRAHLHDTEIILTKVDERIVILDTASNYIRDFQIDDATWCVVLGELGMADCQQLMDRWHGGYAKIACSRAN